MKEQVTNEMLRRYVHNELDWREAVKIRAAIHSDTDIANKYRAFMETEDLLKAANQKEKYRPTKLWYASMAIAACLLLSFGIRFMFPTYDLHWEQTSMRNISTNLTELAKKHLDERENFTKLVKQQLDERLAEYSLKDKKAWMKHLSDEKLKIVDHTATGVLHWQFSVEREVDADKWEEVLEYNSNEDLQQKAVRLSKILLK